MLIINCLTIPTILPLSKYLWVELYDYWMSHVSIAVLKVIMMLKHY